MATAGNVIKQSNFSSGVIYSKYWGEGELLPEGWGTRYRYYYFVATAFKWYASRGDVLIGYGVDCQSLQYWNGSSWVEIAYLENGDKKSCKFEINVSTDESVTNSTYRNTNCPWTHWRMRVHESEDWYPAKAKGRLDIFGLASHLSYDTNIKNKTITSFRAYGGVPWLQAADYAYTRTDSHIYQEFWDPAPRRGTPISAGNSEWLLIPKIL